MNNLKTKLLWILVCSYFITKATAQNATVTVNQPEAIDVLLEYKKDLKTVETYKIQIYSGTNRSNAEHVRSNFRSKYGEWPTEMVFQTPNYKIWAGNFRDRLEADRALLRIKKTYMNAFIFKPKRD